mmetsp:Transcript_18395/g.38489  ORF Transcript_18395/g.38489 Transcript_18395/m.38489 type:complete len:252 (+) Transcript_18395:276-1031(+)
MADKRVTMIKPVVGKVKCPSYALPGNDFVYGIESKLDKEGAGEVVQSWAQSKSSEPPCSMQSFPATNRQALKNGCLSAKAQREYAQQFPVMKQNPKQLTASLRKSNHQKNSTGSSNNNTNNNVARATEFPELFARTKNGEAAPVITSIYQESNGPDQPPQAFGIQSKKNKVSMTELLRCVPTELDDEMDYPNLSGKKRKGRLPPAKATKSSLIVAQCREPPSAEDMAKRKSVEEFKMSKFKNVRPRVKCYM